MIENRLLQQTQASSAKVEKSFSKLNDPMVKDRTFATLLLFSEPIFQKWEKEIMIRDAFFFQILSNLHNLHLLMTWLFYIATSN